MLIKNIMIPLEKLTIISVGDTIKNALEIIDSKNVLSLPVVEGDKFVGVISKKYVFEEFFNTGGDKEAFLSRKVSEFMKTTIEMIHKSDLLEESVKILTQKNIQFIPVLDEEEKFCGIVTHKAVFSTFMNALGIGHTRLVITTHDTKGRLAKLSEVIAKEGGNIKSIIQVDPEVMDIKKLIIRVDSEDTQKLVNALTKNGFTIRRVDKN